MAKTNQIAWDLCLLCHLKKKSRIYLSRLIFKLFLKGQWYVDSNFRSDDVTNLNLRTRVVCLKVIIHINYESITENFVTDITLKFMSDVLPSAARRRFNISWRHRLHFWKAHSCLPLTSLKAIPNISPISNYKVFPVTSGFDRKEGSRDVTRTVTNEDPY